MTSSTDSSNDSDATSATDLGDEEDLQQTDKVHFHDDTEDGLGQDEVSEVSI